MENSVYLCVKQNISCNNFIEADKYFNNNSLSTMIPIYKYLPLFIQHFILKNLFVKTKINFQTLSRKN
jgi:hypothetical protein